MKSRTFMTRNDPSFFALAFFRSAMIEVCRTFDAAQARYWWSEYERRRAASRLVAK